MAERRTQRSGSSRFTPLLPLAMIWSLGAAVLGAIAGQNQVPYEQLLLDPNSVNGVPWYTGLVSNLGVLGWTAAASVGFLGSWVAGIAGRRGAVSMLRGGALLSSILLLDDLFQIHVVVEPLFGVSKPVVYAAYLVLTGWWVLSEATEIRRTRSELLMAAGAAFAGSVAVDQAGTDLLGLTGSGALLVEDAAKFLGVLAWAQYFTLTCVDVVRSILTELGVERAGADPTNRRRRAGDRYHDRLTDDRARSGGGVPARSSADDRARPGAGGGAVVDAVPSSGGPSPGPVAPDRRG